MLDHSSFGGRSRSTMSQLCPLVLLIAGLVALQIGNGQVVDLLLLDFYYTILSSVRINEDIACLNLTLLVPHLANTK